MSQLAEITEAVKLGAEIGRDLNNFFDTKPTGSCRVINMSSEPISVRSYAANDAIMSYSSTDTSAHPGECCDVTASTDVVKIYAAKGTGYWGYFGSASRGPWSITKNNIIVIQDKHMK